MKQSSKKNLLRVFLFIVAFTSLYNNCADGFRVEESISTELSSSQGGDDGGFRPLPVTTTTITTTTSTTLRPVTTTSTSTTSTSTTTTTTLQITPTTSSTTSTTSTTTTTTTTTSTTTSTTTTTVPVSLVPCNTAQFQLPVATHWSNANGGTVVDGASDQFLYENADVNSPRLYFNGFLPESEKYLGDIFSTSKYEDAAVRQFSLDLCQRNGIAIDFRKPSSYTNWNTAKQSAVAKRGALQILTALKVNKSLIDIILPVDWDPNAAAGTYPVIFVGAYDVHDTLRSEGQLEIAAIASLWNTKRLKAIGIVWNGMGSIGTRTMNDGSIEEFNILIQKAAANFGADPQRIVTFGGSRGGLTALRIASNPLNRPYKVLAAYARVPPDQIGTLARLASSTVPALLQATEWSIGLKSVHSPDWRYPNLGNSLTGLTARQAHLNILTGTSDFDQANWNYSLSSARFIQGLRNSGTQVYLEIGSHDFIVPWVDQFRYAKILEQYGIPHELRVNYLAGHWGDSAATEQLLVRVLNQVASRTPGNYFSIGKKSYFRFDSATASLKPVDKPLFTIEFPRKIVPGSGGYIIATGLPGTKYKISFRFNGGGLAESEQVLDGEGKSIWDISGIDDGSYQIEKIFMQEPGKSYVELSMNRKTTKFGDQFIKIDKTSVPFAGTTSALAMDIWKSYLGDSFEFANGAEMTGVSYGVCE